MQYLKSVIISLSLLLPLLVFPQKASLIRIEVPASLESGAFQVEPMGKDGILIFYESNEINDEKQRKWYFGLFDTQLNQVWLKYVPLNDGIYFVKSVQNDHKVHFLFRSEGTGNDGDFYEIVNYDIKKQSFTNISGTIPDNAMIMGFEALGNKGCLGINLKRNSTDVLFINLSNGEIEAQTIEPDNDSYIETIDADPTNRKFYIALKYVKDNRYLDDKIIRYSESGKQEKTYLIKNQEGLKLLRNFVFMPVKDNKLTIMGTYDVITGKMMTMRDLDDDKEAKGVGMFFLQYENDTQTILRYYDFLSFDNIYGSLQGREMDYTKKKNKTGGEEKPNKTLTAFFHFLQPQVLQKENEYIFTVEIYKPYYRLETQMEYDFYGRPIPRTYTVFDGYKFYDMIIASVSSEGKLLWNNDFEMKDMRTFFLHPHVAFFEDGQFFSMAYISKGKLHSLTINGPEDLQSDEVAIETQFPKDRISEDENNNIIHWYDSYFLIYGYQRLKNRMMQEQPVRTVFYVNKIAYN